LREPTEKRRPAIVTRERIQSGGEAKDTTRTAEGGKIKGKKVGPPPPKSIFISHHFLIKRRTEKELPCMRNHNL